MILQAVHMNYNYKVWVWIDKPGWLSHLRHLFLLLSTNILNVLFLEFKEVCYFWSKLFNYKHVLHKCETQMQKTYFASAKYIYVLTCRGHLYIDTSIPVSIKKNTYIYGKKYKNNVFGFTATEV